MQLPHSPRPHRSRAGRAAPLVAALLGALAVMGALVLALRDGGSPPASGAAPQAPRPGGSAAAPTDSDPERAEAPGGAVATIEVGAPRRIDRPADARRGRGSLRGTLEVAGDEPLRDARVVLVPSDTLRGREAGDSRALDLEDGTRDFAFADLPLAGYELRVTARGLNARVQRVLLEQPVVDQFVVVQLVPAGFVDGRVLDVDGRAVGGLAVTLEARPAGTRQAVVTDPGGAFHLPGVLDGDYRLTAGDADLPLDAKELRFRAPSLHVELRVPALGHLSCLVVDGFGAALEGIAVQGYGPEGSSVSGTSDRAGRVELPHLPAGDYRLTARDERHGRGRASVRLEAGERTDARLVLTGP